MYDEDMIETVLNHLGFVVDRVEETGRGSEMYASCPGHVERLGKSDRSASWSVNAESGRHNCFSCGFSGSMVGLVAYVKKFETTWGVPDHEAAKRWIEDSVGLDVSKVREHLQSLREYYTMDQPVPMSEARLAVFGEPPSRALEARGVTAEVAARYGVKWAAQSEVWITPIRDPFTKQLLGWQEKGQGHRFFMNRPTNLKKSRTLFGWEQYAGGPAVVVESPLDAVRISTVLPHVTGLATMGAMISDVQFRLLSGVEELVFAFDNPNTDAAGRKASQVALKKAVSGLYECSFFFYEKRGAKDPGDMTDDEVWQGWEERRHEILGERAYLTDS